MNTCRSGGRRRCANSSRHARRYRPLPLRDGRDLAALPPLIRIARCASGKLCYFSADDAELAMAGSDRTRPARRECRVYACSICIGWHLTSLAEYRSSLALRGSREFNRDLG